MKRQTISITVMAASLLLVSPETRTAGQSAYISNNATGAIVPASPTVAPAAANTAWPMVFTSGDTTCMVFQPQCDSWDGHNLSARSAVSMQAAGQAQPSYGVVRYSAITLVDKATRSAKLADLKVTSADFPSARAKTEDYLAILNRQFPQNAPAVPLENLETSMTLALAPAKPESLNNLPPKVIIATRPAMLVYIDGPPALRPVPGTGLQRVINTRVLLLQDSAGQYYLHLYDGYLQASSLNGPWTVASQPPKDAAVAEKAATDSGQVDLMLGQVDAATGKMPTLSTAPRPDIYVETRPAELITFNGPPSYVPIPGTDLLYADNTTGNVFKYLKDQQHYLLISGRWYRAPSLKGPWQFVPGNQLPGDFANIPDTSPKENVKASVPGTDQAEEALIANAIPQSTAVPRTTQMAAPQIDGAPQLAAIDGTPLHYVENSATPIIEVNPQAWYACQNGVWYVSTSASGPWDVATQVPQVIYTIPTTSPLHYLTYVQVYGSTPDQVYEGYTPGYFGTEVAPDDTVVYGTGYDYAPWIGDVWYGPPVTWGCGFAPCWSPWDGWGFGCGFGWGCGFGFGWGCCWPPFPWWGGFCGYGRGGFGWNHGFGGFGFNHGFNNGFGRGGFGGQGFANTAGDLYGHGGFGASREQFAGNGFNARAVGANQFGRAYNSRTGQLAAGQNAQVRSVTGSAWNSAGNRGFASARQTGAGRSFDANQGSFANRGSGLESRSFGGFQNGLGGMNRGFQGFQGGFRGFNPGNTFRSSPSFGGGFGGGFRGYGGGFRS
ncbi:MAG TPA: hypothetical protein VL970_02960, partial [Candidatus Acidoferrales bacterium]|nr:hypothetical protein [Candidatus Acidoferrales bacterium]